MSLEQMEDRIEEIKDEIEAIELAETLLYLQSEGFIEVEEDGDDFRLFIVGEAEYWISEDGTCFRDGVEV